MLSEQQLDRVRRFLRGGLRAKKAGHRQTAKRRFEWCVSLDDGDRPTTEATRAAYRPLFFGYALLADIAEQERAFERAIRLANRALVDPIARKGALRTLGTCSAECGRLEEAEAAFRDGLAGESKPDVQVRWYVFLFSVVYQDATRHDEAKRLLQKALELDPDCEEAHYNIGVALMNERDLDSAQQHLERAIELDPDYAYPHMKLGELHLRHVRLAEDPQQQHNAARSAEYYLTRSIELQGECLTSQLLLINLHWMQSRYRKAEAECRKTILCFPDSSVAHWVYGDLLATSDRGRVKAETLLRKAIELDSEDSGAYYHLGKALLGWERWCEARTMLEQAHRLGNDRALTLLRHKHS